MSINVQDASNDFSKFIKADMDEKLKPVNKLIDDMHARLEEFQTMIHFAKQERINAVSVLTSISNSHKELADLFQRIDSVEKLVDHVKSNLSALEKDIEKAEEEIGYTESTTTKVASIFTPLFKKSTETSQSSTDLPIYKTSDYFHPSDEGTSSES